MRKAIVAIAFVFLACLVAAGLVSWHTAATSPRGVKTRSVVQTSTSGAPVTEEQAIAIAEDLAAKDSKGDPIRTKPSTAQSMSFSDAEAELGSGQDFSLRADALVWLVRVYGSFGAPMSRPWLPSTTDMTTTSTTAAQAVHFSVVVDQATGRVVIENY